MSKEIIALTNKQLIAKYHQLLKENVGLDIRSKKYIAEMTAITSEIDKRGIKYKELYGEK